MMQHAPLEFSLFSLIHCFTEVTYTAEHGCLRCSVPQAGTTLDTKKTSYIFNFHQPPKSFVLLSGHPHVHDAPYSDFYCCLYRYSLQFMLNASWTASFYTITTTVYLLVHGICQAPHPHKCPNHHYLSHREGSEWFSTWWAGPLGEHSRNYAEEKHRERVKSRVSVRGRHQHSWVKDPNVLDPQETKAYPRLRK